MRSFNRADRVSGQIRRILSELLQKNIKDPRLKSATITGVDLTRDLRYATVYFVLSEGRGSREEAAAGFQSAMGYLKRTIAPELGLRYMPELKFCYDESMDYGARIENVLRSLKTDDESNH